jgi:hypothetical protein
MANTETSVATQSVKRNGKEYELAPFKIVRGDNKDKTYLAPQVTASNWDKFIEWFGLDNAVNVLQGFSKRACQLLHKNAIDKISGVLDMNKFLAGVANLTAAGLRLRELKEQLDEVVEQQQELLGKLSEAEGDAQAALLKEIMAMKNRILSLKQMIEERQRDTSEDEEEKSVSPSIPA